MTVIKTETHRSACDFDLEEQTFNPLKGQQDSIYLLIHDYT